MNSGWKLDQDILILFNAMAADVHYDLDFDKVSDYASMKTEARRNASTEILPITITSRQRFMIGTAPEEVTVA